MLTHTGLLYIGDLGIAERSVRIILAYRDPGIRGDALRDAIRPRNATRAVVLLPAGRSLPGVEVASLDHVLSPTQLIGRIAKAVEMDAYVPAVEIAPAGARFIVDDLAKRAWLDGVALDLTPVQFDFVRKVAVDTLQNRSVPSKSTGSAALRSGRGDRAAAKTKSDTMARILASFQAAGVQTPPKLSSLFVSRKGWGYTLSVPPYVRTAP